MHREGEPSKKSEPYPKSIFYGNFQEGRLIPNEQLHGLTKAVISSGEPSWNQKVGNWNTN